MAKIPTLNNFLPTLKPSHGLQTIVPGSWRAPDQSSTARGYGYRWQKARAGFLLKHPLCVLCTELDGRDTVATVVDHTIPHRGDMALFWDRSNWRPLCERHHNSDAQRKDNEYGRSGPGA